MLVAIVTIVSSMSENVVYRGLCWITEAGASFS